MDISAAFDTVHHGLLLSRLFEAGVRDNALSWFTSYLSQRCQVVSYKDKWSRPVTVTCGVPQGSVLGPILFNLYMASLSKFFVEKSIRHHIYADDLLIYMRITGKADIDLREFTAYQSAIDSLVDWMCQQQLAINPGKTQCLLLSNRSIHSAYLPKLTISGEPLVIQTEGDMKYLGVHIDSKLQFKKHVTQVCKSAYYQLRMIRHIRPCLDLATTKFLCNLLVLSRLDYCGTILQALQKHEQDRLQKVINLSARTIFCLARPAHISPSLKELEWLKLPQRSMYRALCLIHKVLYGTGPDYLSEELQWYTPKRTLRSAEKSLLEHTIPLRSAGRLILKSYGPLLWNNLPEECRKEKRRWAFEMQVHSHLIISD
jgi:hypothetical protein